MADELEAPGQAMVAAERSILSRFIEGALSMGAATMATTVLGLAATVFVVRLLAPEDFGAYVLLQVGYVFMAEASSFGMTMAIPRFVAGATDDQYRSDFIKTTLYFRFLTVALFGAVGCMAAPLIGRVSASPIVADLALYAVLLFGLESLGGALTSILEGLFRFRAIAKIRLVSSGSYLALLGAFLLLLDRGIVGVVQAKAISLALGYGYGCLAIPRNRRAVWRFSILKEALAFGLPLQLQYLLDFAYNRVDTLIVGTMLGTAGVAFYEVARKIPQTLNSFYEAFRIVYLPFVSNLAGNGDRKKLMAMLNHSIRWLSFLTAAAALVALLFGKEIVVFLFSVEYESSVPAFVLLMIGLNLGFTENTLGYSLIAIGEPDKPLRVNAGRAVVNLVGNLLLIPVFGFVGAALASLAGNLAAVPLDIHFLSRRMIRTEVRDCAKSILAFGACAVGFLALGPTPVAMKFAMLGVFCGMCLLSSAITVGDLSAVGREIRPVLASMRGKPGFLGAK